MGRRLTSLLVLVGLATGLGLASATPANADTYTISGAISLPAGAPEAWEDQIYVSIGGDTSFTVKADASNGKFSFTGLEDGWYDLKAYAYPPGGNGEVPNLVTEYYGGSYLWEDRTTITINGASATGNNIDLDFGAILRGQLYPHSSLTMADMQGVQVTATGPSGVTYRATGNGTTGMYAITGMIPGAYTLRVDATSYSGAGGGSVTPNVASVYDGPWFDVPSTYNLAATSGSSSYTRNLVPYEAFTASGTVSLEEGADPALLGGVKVTFTSEYHSTGPSATVDPVTGAWSLPGLPRVTYYGARASGLGLVPKTYPVSLTYPSSDLDLGMITLAAGRTVSGTVTLNGVTPTEEDPIPTYVQFASPGYTSPAILVDEDTRTYTSEGLPPGTYTARFWGPYPVVVAEEYYNDVYDVADATPIVVTADADITGINAELSPVRHFTATPTPTFTGTKGLGNTLTVSKGTWKSTPEAFSYQWYRNGSAISGATKSTYKLTSSDSTKKISVKVTGSKPTYTSVSKTSAQVTMPKFFTKAPTPAISGTLRSGHTLTAKAGTWSPSASLSYQWYRNGVAISKATKSTYKLTSTDKGKKIQVRVRAAKSGYGTDYKYSSAKTVYLEFSKAPTPTISGTAKAGSTLTAKAGTWSPTATLSYQWYRNGVRISGATKATYKLTSSDKGKKISVNVAGKKSGYYTIVKSSASKTVAK
ncbi:hypothetical protein [Demequina sp.]|uniref:hypothetical protein n=1 Tax=Demequina sp. TaxID=2050685 RepID=UPI003D1198B7